MPVIPIKIKSKLRTVPWDKLKPFQGSLKEMTEDDAMKLRASILKHGWRFPMFVWKEKKNNWIHDGHGRLNILKALVEEGYTIGEIPVVDITAKDKREAAELLLAVNSRFGKATPEGLYEFMNEMGLDVETLLEYDFPDLDIDDFISNFFEEVNEQADETPEPPEPEKVRTKAGDVYHLGKHTLMCGDSTNKKDVAELMDGSKADMVFTDPPYGVSYTGIKIPNRRKWNIIKGDDLRNTDLHKLLLGAFQNIFLVTKDTPAVYICYSSANHTIFEEALKKAGFQVRQQLIWKKHLVVGHLHYHSSHEPIFYCSKEKTAEWYGDRTSKTFILSTPDPDFTALRKADMVEMLVQIHKDSTILAIARERNYVHPTQKPVELPTKAIQNSSPHGGLLFEPFGGSGSTLIAAEVTGRVCKVMEFDPKYCDVIVQRYVNYTGSTDVTKNGKKDKWRVTRKEKGEDDED